MSDGITLLRRDLVDVPGGNQIIMRHTEQVQVFIVNGVEIPVRHMATHDEVCTAVREAFKTESKQ